MESGQDFRHLGEQIGQSGRYLLELGHGAGAGTILFHLNSVEHGYDISKLSCPCLVLLEWAGAGCSGH